MKRFKQFTEEMSVTLKQHGSTSYKVHAVGSKMKAHGGLRVGETVHDHHIDDLRDSGIKVRYHKEDIDIVEDTTYHTSHYHDKYSEKEEHPIHDRTGLAMDAIHDAHKENKFKGVKFHTAMGDDEPHAVTVSKDSDLHKHAAAKHLKKLLPEAIERKADSKLIMVTDPVTGKTVLRKAPRREIEIGKGKMESVQVDEISDKMKVNYINKANKQITDKEKVHLKVGASNVKDKSLEKRRMGVRMAKSKLGEEEYSKKEVRMGKGVAFDKRYKQGNYSGAHKTIEKIKKGLASHPKVKDALRRANEEFNKGE